MTAEIVGLGGHPGAVLDRLRRALARIGKPCQLRMRDRAELLERLGMPVTRHRPALFGHVFVTDLTVPKGECLIVPVDDVVAL